MVLTSICHDSSSQWTGQSAWPRTGGRKGRAWPRSLESVARGACHHQVELLVVDLAVTVDVGLLDHGVDLVVVQLLAQVHHDDGQFPPVDEAVAVL